MKVQLLTSKNAEENVYSRSMHDNRKEAVSISNKLAEKIVTIPRQMVLYIDGRQLRRLTNPNCSEIYQLTVDR